VSGEHKKLLEGPHRGYEATEVAAAGHATLEPIDAGSLLGDIDGVNHILAACNQACGVTVHEDSVAQTHQVADGGVVGILPGLVMLDIERISVQRRHLAEILVLRAEEVEILEKVVVALDVSRAAVVAEVLDPVAKRAEELLENDDFGRGFDDANVFQQSDSWLDERSHKGKYQALPHETEKVGDETKDVQIPEGAKKTIKLGIRINEGES